jgi:hypothetical protein
MRGIPQLNYPAFHAAERLLTPRYVVFSPARADMDRGFDASMFPTGTEALPVDVRELLELDTRWVCRHADGVALLDGWAASKGAQAEYALARALDIPAHPVTWWLGSPP